MLQWWNCGYPGWWRGLSGSQGAWHRGRVWSQKSVCAQAALEGQVQRRGRCSARSVSHFSTVVRSYLIAGPISAKAGEPPLPFPPPPPFIPLDSSKVDSQIGLLKNFYQERFTAFAASSASIPPPPHPAAPAPAPMLPLAAPANRTPLPNPYPPFNPFLSSSSTLPSTSAQPQPMDALATPLVLPDDPPNPTRAKIGPLGQVIMSNPATAGSKKKGKAKDTAGDKGNDKDGGEGTVPGPKKKEPKKKKNKDGQAEGVAEVEGNPANPEVNGTGPKKKMKSTGAGGGKNSVNSGKPSLEVRPAIIASA